MVGSRSARPSRCLEDGGATTSIRFDLSGTCRGWTWEVQRMRTNRLSRYDPMVLAAVADARDEHRGHRDERALFERHLRRAERRRRPFEWYRDDAWRRRIRGA